MKRITSTVLLIICFASIWWGFFGRARPDSPDTASAEARPLTRGPTQWIAAPGRVEPASEEVKIGSEVDGRLRRVFVSEGQAVRAGEILAELENSDYKARVDLNKALLAESEASVQRLTKGSRQEERIEAASQVHEAQAVLDNADREVDRRRGLLDRGAISRSEFDSADRDFRVAQAHLDGLIQRRSLVDDATRPEDLARACAAVEAARARLAESESLLLKTVIRSPLNGVILRKKLNAGEPVSGRGDPPVVTVGNLSRLRIRVDVDESDVARLRVGQRSWVTAPAYGTRRFAGRVVEIGQILGRKNIRTDEPTERVDTKILETLVELDREIRLPVGLRVDAFIDPRNGDRKQAK